MSTTPDHLEEPDTTSPTARWRAAAPELPALTDPAAVTAERLLLLVHYGLDWDSWIADHVHRYWDELLPARIRSATYRADSLTGWWSLVCEALPVGGGGDRARRLEVAQLLGEPAAPVLAVLRDHLPAVVLRVRLIAESVKAARGQARTTPGEETRQQ